jgi:hypothetical protein
MIIIVSGGLSSRSNSDEKKSTKETEPSKIKVSPEPAEEMKN